jgi:pantoate kinase
MQNDLTDTLNSRKNVPEVARAFVPGHITGFFQIHDEAHTPLLRGSRGAGFSVAIGTFTSVSATENDSLELTTIYNDEEIDAQVTNMVIRRMVEDYGKKFNVKVVHESALPSGAGFGASGAGALGAALAFGNILDPMMAYDTAASYAHEAEVVNHTGLGDVLAQTKGGMEIRVRPGGPGVGEIMHMAHADPLCVVLAGAPGLKTHDVLTNPESRLRINNVGDDLVERIISKPDLNTFISCSRKFTESIGLASKRVTLAIDELDSLGFNKSSMVMLGDSVFCFCDDTNSGTVIELLGKYWDSSQVISTTISDKGGRLVSW